MERGTAVPVVDHKARSGNTAKSVVKGLTRSVDSNLLLAPHLRFPTYKPLDPADASDHHYPATAVGRVTCPQHTLMVFGPLQKTAGRALIQIAALPAPVSDLQRSVPPGASHRKRDARTLNIEE